MQRLQEVCYPNGKIEQFKYDNAGNRALKKYGTAENFKTGNYLEEHYQYDNRNRLLERKNPKDVTYYQYDNQGNTVSELTKRFLKPETTKVQQADGRTLVSNRLAKTELEQYKTYEYNAFNQTSKVTVEEYLESGKEIHVQENFYDAENQRYSIEEDGERTNFVTNGWSVFTEQDAEWKLTRRLLRGYGIVASEESFDSDDYHYYHQNEHGDIEYITGKDGKIENAYTYDAFGNITNSDELIRNRYTYNGEQYDTTTSQYYLRARYYNPLIARFTQEDVYRGDGLNLYAYCGNNPVMYVDPSGYEFLENIAYDTEEDITKRINQTPSETATYGDWEGKRGDSNFEFSNKDGSAFHNRVESTLAKHGTSTIPYKQGQVDFDEFAVFTVEVEVSSNRKVTHPRTNEAIAQTIVQYGGDYDKMYADNVMGIASGSKYSQDMAKSIIESAGIYAKADMSDTGKVELVHSLLDDMQKSNHQTIHEENLVKGKTKNKTQWVDTDINKQFGHLGGTSEAKRQEQESKCSGGN